MERRVHNVCILHGVLKIGEILNFIKLRYSFSLVTPHSRLRFQVRDHSTFRKDPVIGQRTVELYQVLHYYNGKLENLELTLELMPEPGKSASYVQSSVGKLITFFNGLNVNLQSVPQPHFVRPSK